MVLENRPTVWLRDFDVHRSCLGRHRVEEERDRHRSSDCTNHALSFGVQAVVLVVPRKLNEYATRDVRDVHDESIATALRETHARVVLKCDLQVLECIDAKLGKDGREELFEVLSRIQAHLP